MRLALLIAGVLAPLAAAAPPALAQPARCDVHILRSPDPVRLVIEARMRREAKCETSLMLRVVPTTAGLYLLAHTPAGRTYEMVVPDAETAAELAVTWAKRREAAPAPIPPLAPPAIAPPPVEARPVASGPPAAVESSYAVPRVLPPGATPELGPREREPGPPAGQWLALAAVAGADGGGVRGELDIWSKRGWSAGVAIAYTAMQMAIEGQLGGLEFGDLRGVVTAGHTRGRGALRLRGQIGVGAVRTEMGGFLDGFGPIAYSGTHAIGEAGAHVQLVFGRDRAWALTGGPLLTLYSQTYVLSNGPEMGTASRTLDVSFVGGLRRRL